MVWNHCYVLPFLGLWITADVSPFPHDRIVGADPHPDDM